jgi:hypothetical protein
MKKISEVTLILENCETIKFLPENIYHLFFTIDKTNYSTYNSNEIRETLFSDYFYMSFNNLEKMFNEDIGNKNKSVLDRLKIKDITHVKIKYEDSTALYFAVPWEGNSLYINSSQNMKKVNVRYEIIIDKKFRLYNYIKDLINCYKESKYSKKLI